MRRIFKYARHCLEAKNTKGHGVHSPYLFRFVSQVVHEKGVYYCFADIEALRAELLASRERVFLEDFGSKRSREEVVRRIAKRSLKSPKLAQLLFRIVYWNKSSRVLELGTSLGLTTSYLASANPDAQCVTLEGSRALCELAQRNFDSLGLTNIRVVQGNIDETLSLVLNELGTLDFVFFDANHTYEATMRYFEQCLPYVHEKTIFVFDDIYWSYGMTKAWGRIRRHIKVACTMDLYHVGVVFFDSNFLVKDYKVIV